MDAGQLVGAGSFAPTISWINVVVTMGATAAMYLLAGDRAVPTALPIVTRLLPNCSETLYAWIEMVLVIGCGTFIGVFFCAPTNYQQCIAAGFGSFALLNAAANKLPKRPSPRTATFKTPGATK